MLQSVVAPRSIADVAKAMSKSAGPMLMAGGTTVMPMINSGQHDVATLVSLCNLGLDKVSISKKSGVTIGAATPIVALSRCKELAFLEDAITSFGSPTLRNMATVGGNLFVQRPAGDFAVCLVALGASATIAKGKSERVEAVETLVRKGLKPGEIVTQVSFSLPAAGTFKFRKVGRRALNTPAIITVAAVIPVVKGVIKNCRVALGAVVPRPARAAHVEKLLEGKPLTLETVSTAAMAANADIDPADDAVASAWYRARVAPVHIRRAIMGEK